MFLDGVWGDGAATGAVRRSQGVCWTMQLVRCLHCKSLWLWIRNLQIYLIIIFYMWLHSQRCRDDRRAAAGRAGRAGGRVYIAALKGRPPRQCTYYDVMNGDILAAFDFTCKASSSVPFVMRSRRGAIFCVVTFRSSLICQIFRRYLNSDMFKFRCGFVFVDLVNNHRTDGGGWSIVYYIFNDLIVCTTFSDALQASFPYVVVVPCSSNQQRTKVFEYIGTLTL